MKYTTRSEGKVYIFELKGKVMGGPESAAFHEDLKKAVGDGQRKVILDLGEVEWMNSSGLGRLKNPPTSAPTSAWPESPIDSSMGMLSLRCSQLDLLSPVQVAA